MIHVMYVLFICVLFMNMRQFINDHVLINYFKKQGIQLYYNKYTHTWVLQIIYNKKLSGSCIAKQPQLFQHTTFRKPAFLQQKPATAF
jgi:hypothetical protein